MRHLPFKAAHNVAEFVYHCDVPRWGMAWYSPRRLLAAYGILVGGFLATAVIIDLVRWLIRL